MIRAIGRINGDGISTTERYAHHMLRILLSLVLFGGAASAQQPEGSDPNQLPWFVRPGESALRLRLQVPVVNQVVLVPDLTTLIDEVSKWSRQGHWPVLIDDSYYASMFIRAFKPGRVLRRTDRVDRPSKLPMRQQMMESAVGAVWGGKPGMPIREAVSASGLLPAPGLVVTEADDSAAAAAVLLAAGRGQPLVFLDIAAGDPDTVMGTTKSMALAAAVEQAAVRSGLTWQALGDQIDTITLCRRLPARVTTRMPVANPAAQGEPVALTDVIGRRADGSRWAFTGWMVGSAALTAYQANCSLFLHRGSAWMCNTYPDSGNWATWGLAPAAETLTQAGYEVSLQEHVSLNQLLALERAGIDDRQIWMNTKGNADFFRMGDGADADPGEVPILNSPAVLNFIHSWSLRSPESLDSVGGRWLQRGVYCYTGSSQEPQLNGFVEPSLMARRISGGVPWIIASRYWGESKSAMARVWRINTIGDPLMIAPPPKQTGRRRRPPTKEALPPGTIDVRAAAVAGMKSLETVTSDETFASTIHDVVLIGKDEIAAQLWAAAMQQQAAGPASARAAFGSLFRLAKHEAMLEAWKRLAPASALEGDMLWGALAPQISAGGLSDAEIEALRQSIGPGSLVHRIKALAPLIASRWGSGAAVAAINAARAHATNSRQQRELDAISKEFSG